VLFFDAMQGHVHQFKGDNSNSYWNEIVDMKDKVIGIIQNNEVNNVSNVIKILKASTISSVGQNEPPTNT
jgi:hypothetical protein